jgi:hypothetical protein
MGSGSSAQFNHLVVNGPRLGKTSPFSVVAAKDWNLPSSSLGTSSASFAAQAERDIPGHTVYTAVRAETDYRNIWPACNSIFKVCDILPLSSAWAALIQGLTCREI